MLEKKRWNKPQLIVLARGTPEEAVLDSCKRIDQVNPTGQQGPAETRQSDCSRGYTDGTNCGACQARSNGGS